MQHSFKGDCLGGGGVMAHIHNLLALIGQIFLKYWFCVTACTA